MNYHYTVKNIIKFYVYYVHEVVYYIKIYKFESQHFFIRCTFFFLIKINTIGNSNFKFLTKICEIRKKRKIVKLFVLMRSTNFV